MTTAELIKTYREKRKLTQKQLSEMLCYDNPQFISLLENGHNKLPLHSAKSFCSVLKIAHTMMINALVEDFRQRVLQYFRSV